MTDTTKCNDGFTLVELVIASAVLLMVLTSVVGVLVFSAQSAQMQRQKEGATNIANEKLEIARNLPYDRLGVAGKSPSGDVLATEVVRGYTVNTVIEWQQDPATGTRMDKKVSVDVTWSLPKVGHLVLSTNVFGKSLLSNVGDVEVRVRYAKDSQPVAAVSCAVASMSGTTNSKGIAFFGAVPIGVYNDSDPANTKKITVVAPTDYVYSVADVQAKSVAADSLTTIIVTLQKSSKVTYTFRDEGPGHPIINGVALSLLNADGLQIGTTTTTDGRGSFTGLTVSSYTLNYTVSGYASTPKQLDITTEGTDAQVDILLSPLPTAGEIAVLVQDKNNAKLTNASVTIKGNNSSTPTVQPTSDGGGTTFKDMPFDTYTITVTYAGYQAQTQTLVLVAGVAGNAVFNLSPASTKGQIKIVTKEDGHVTGYIKVDISGPSRYDTSLTSDKYGNILTDYLPEGSYKVKTHKNSTSTVTTLVTGGNTNEIEVNKNKN